jgi:large subunit ribosomal protein L34
MAKMTLQRKAKKRSRVHGFLKRMMNHDGRNVIKRRRSKGRKELTV